MLALLGILLFCGVAVLGYFLVTHVIAKVEAMPTPQQAHDLELRRVELDLRALEYKQRFNPAQYTRTDEDAYSMLIRKRNAMVPSIAIAAASRPAARPKASRYVGGPVRLL